jgi:hypothetical protein
MISGCHSPRSARDVAGDPVLAPAFSRHARWLASQPGMESFDSVHENGPGVLPTRPDTIYDRREWSQSGAWAMPTSR